MMRFSRVAALAVLVLASALLLQPSRCPASRSTASPSASGRAIGAARMTRRSLTRTTPAAVGHSGCVLHAWEQFDTAAAVYARARGLERRFDWFYLGGLVETRLAHHEAAARPAQRCREACAGIPARAGSRWRMRSSSRRRDGSRARVRGPDDRPVGAARALRPWAASSRRRAIMKRRCAQLETAVALYPEFGAAWYTLGWRSAISDAWTRPAQSLAQARAVRSALAGRGRPAHDARSARSVTTRTPHAERGLALAETRRRARRDRRVRGRGRREPGARLGARQPDRAVRRSSGTGRMPRRTTRPR